MTEISRKIAVLQTISDDNSRNLGTLEALRAQAQREIATDGGLTQSTCEQMAAMFRDIEESARRLYTGILSTHQSAAEFVPEGANEGQKPWPP